MHGASIIAEGGKIMIGEHCIIFENAVVRSNANHSAAIGNFCLIGPMHMLLAARLKTKFLSQLVRQFFNSAHLGKGSQIRINAVVHLKSHLEPGALVPIDGLLLEIQLSYFRQVNMKKYGKYKNHSISR